MTRTAKQQHRELKDKDQAIEELGEKQKASDILIEDLYDRCNYQEDYNRRNNLQFIGIEEKQEGETWEQSATLVSKLLEEKLEMPNIQLERAHRVGQRGDHRARPIVARSEKFCDRETVLRNVHKLRGTRIFVNEDLCPASHNIRKAQLPAMKQAKSEGKLAFFRHTKLMIKEKPSVNQPNEPLGQDVSAGLVRGGGSSGGGRSDGLSTARGATTVSAVPFGSQSVPALVTPAPDGADPAAAADGGVAVAADCPAVGGTHGAGGKCAWKVP